MQFLGRGQLFYNYDYDGGSRCWRLASRRFFICGRAMSTSFAFRTTLSHPPNRRRSYNNSGCWSSPKTDCAGWAGDSDDGAGAGGGVFAAAAAHGADVRTTRCAADVWAAAAAGFAGPRRPRFQHYRHCWAAEWLAADVRYCWWRTWSTGQPRRSPDGSPTACRPLHHPLHRSALTWTVSVVDRTATDPGRRPRWWSPTAHCSGQPVQKRNQQTKS